MTRPGLLLPLVAAVLGACSSMSAPVDPAGRSDSPRVEPMMRVTAGVPADQAAYIDGKTHLAAHRFDLAIESFRQALRLNPRHVDSLNGMGVAHSLAQRQPEAIVAFGQAVELTPDNAQWHANLGMALARDGQFEQARSVLAKAWALAPANALIEAQYQRVSASAREQELSRRQRQGQHSVAAPITSDIPRVGLRQLGERVFELDLDQPAEVTVEAPAGAEEPVVVEASVTDQAPRVLAAPLVDATTIVQESPTIVDSPTATEEMPPVQISAAADSPLGTTIEQPEQLAQSQPSVDARPDPTTLPYVYEGRRSTRLPDTSVTVSPDNAVPNAPGLPVSEPSSTAAPATPLAAPATAEVEASAVDASAVEASALPADAAAQTEPSEALEAARQALYQRRLEAARIRAARTQAIDDAAAAAGVPTRR